MSRWFRIYDEALDDHKVQSISPELFRTWFNLLCVASRNDGILPSVEKLAFALRVSVNDMQARLDELILLGLMDIKADRKIEPHNWPKRQWKSDDSKERVRKHREAKRQSNGDVTVTVTPPESYSETDTDTDHGSSRERARKTNQGFVSDFLMGKDDGEEKLKRNAEALGLDVDSLVKRTNDANPKKRSAYFTKLCVTDLLEKHPGLNEGLIRDALWDKGRAKNDLFEAVLK